jgi:hypothetical protein
LQACLILESRGKIVFQQPAERGKICPLKAPCQDLAVWVKEEYRYPAGINNGGSRMVEHFFAVAGFGLLGVPAARPVFSLHRSEKGRGK